MSYAAVFAKKVKLALVRAKNWLEAESICDSRYEGVPLFTKILDIIWK